MGANAIKAEDQAAAPARLARLARKRLERFAVLFARTLVNDAADTIHHLRVASRRLQQVLRIALPDFKSKNLRKLYRLPRQARRAYGACRNFDVSLSLVEKRLAAASSAPSRRAWKAVGTWLAEQRGEALARARGELKGCDLIGFVLSVRRRLEEMHLEAALWEELWDRVRDAFDAWRDSLAAARSDGDAESIHAFRIAGKRLRYRAEMLAAAGEPSVKRLVRDLKELQKNLGDWRDRYVLRRQAGEFIAKRGFLAESPGPCRALLLAMDKEKQRDQAAVGAFFARAAEIAERQGRLFSSGGPPGKKRKAQ